MRCRKVSKALRESLLWSLFGNVGGRRGDLCRPPSPFPPHYDHCDWRSLEGCPRIRKSVTALKRENHVGNSWLQDNGKHPTLWDCKQKGKTGVCAQVPRLLLKPGSHKEAQTDTRRQCASFDATYATTGSQARPASRWSGCDPAGSAWRLGASHKPPERRQTPGREQSRARPWGTRGGWIAERAVPFPRAPFGSRLASLAQEPWDHPRSADNMVTGRSVCQDLCLPSVLSMRDIPTWQKNDMGWSAVMLSNSGARAYASPQAGTLLSGRSIHGYMKREKSGRHD